MIIQKSTFLKNGKMTTDMQGDKNPCIKCGACCVSFPSEEKKENNCTKCIALTGEVGKQVNCSIYLNRPTICREFNVWDSNGQPNPKCQELRAKIKLPPLEKQIK